jgi:hypothetical protein
MLSRHQSQLRRAYEKAWKEIEALKDHRREEEQAKLQNEPKRRLTPALLDLLTAPPTANRMPLAALSAHASNFPGHTISSKL